jgi:hypothetical protein
VGRFIALVLLVVSSAAQAADDRKDIPKAIYDAIDAKITFQTTFVQFTEKEAVRWQPRSIDITTFVKAPSPTYKDTYLYAMIYKVVVTSDKVSLNVHGTTCQAVVVVKYGEWTDPTVVCEPVDLNRADQPS